MRDELRSNAVATPSVHSIVVASNRPNRSSLYVSLTKALGSIQETWPLTPSMDSKAAKTHSMSMDLPAPVWPTTTAPVLKESTLRSCRAFASHSGDALMFLDEAASSSAAFKRATEMVSVKASEPSWSVEPSSSTNASARNAAWTSSSKGFASSATRRGATVARTARNKAAGCVLEQARRFPAVLSTGPRARSPQS